MNLEKVKPQTSKRKKSGSLIKDYIKYKDVPEDKQERFTYLFDELNVKEKDLNRIKNIVDDIREYKRTNRKSIKMIFYIVPEGIARPRMGFGGRFYVPNIQKFYDYMDYYMNEHKELFNGFIFSECTLDLKYFLPMPSNMTKDEKILAEMKLIRCTKKPDWDNLGKSTDMFHKFILDDSLVTESRVRKYYSFKPRMEIKINYYDKSTNSYHRKSLKKLKGGSELDD